MKPSSLAKITKPQTSGALLRTRLFRLIDSSSNRQITWICGPAGAGKTTLAASYLHERHRHCLWYQLDEGDADIATFFYYLELAAEKSTPKRRKKPLLFSPEHLPGIHIFAKRYFEGLFCRLLRSATTRGDDQTAKKFCIVLDNYQEVPPDSLLHHLLAIGLTALPMGIQVLIISREEPPQQYARLRANERIALLGWNDISFTREESSKILPLQTREKIGAGGLEQLLAKSQGWAAGLVLFNESLNAGKADLPILCAPPTEGIFDYFAEEIYNRLEKELRDFLVKTSFLPQMTPHTAGSLAETNHGAAILKNLNQRNCFTEKRSLPQLTYQYHPLFREFLLNKAARTLAKKDILRLEREAARLLMEAGQIEDAVELLMRSEAWGEVVPILTTHAPSFLAQGRIQTVQEWLQSLPGPILGKEITLTYYLGLCRLAFDPAEGLSLFEKVFQAAQEQGDVPWALMAWSEAVNSILYGWNHFAILDDWIEWLNQWIKTQPEMPSQAIEAKVATSMTGALIFRCPDQPESIRQWIDRALTLAREGHDHNLQAQIIGYALQYYSSLGDATNNDAILYELKSIPASSINSPMAVITLKWMEAVSCNWCKADPDTAIELINEGLNFARVNGINSGDHFLFAVGTYSALLKGDLTMAGDFLQRIEETLDCTRFHSFCQYNYIASLYHFIRGDITVAQQYAKRALKYALETGIYFPVLFCRLGIAHILLESGAFDQAALHLAEVEAPVKNTRSGILEYSLLLAKAKFFLFTERRDEGLDSLRQALQLARLNGYTWLFWWWHPQSMARLCACALETGIEVVHVQKIIRTCNLPPNDISTAPANWPFPLEVVTMGHFEIVRDGTPLRFSGKSPQKPLEMLRALIALGGKNIREEQLSEILWPEADGDAAHKSFEVNLVRLRKLLGGQRCISYQGGLVSIERTCCRVDALVLEQLLDDAEKAWELLTDDKAEAVQMAERVVNMYRGDFLPADTQCAWTVACRERLRSRTLQLLTKVGSHWMETGCREKALACFQRGLEIDQLSEAVYQNLILCRHRLGQKAEAVTTYKQCRRALSVHLGISPSAATEKLYRQVVDG